MQLNARYRDQGLVLIGIHSTRGGEQMEGFAKAKGIDFPIAIDSGDKMLDAYAVDSYPDYYVIDKTGKLRFADLANADLEAALKLLLAEPGGVPKDPAAKKAIEVSRRKDKRVLALWGSEEKRATFAAAQRDDRAFATLLRNEYELLNLSRKDHAKLANAAKLPGEGFALTVYDTGMIPLASLDASEASPSDIQGFLEANRIPAQDAQDLWAQAMAQAERERKRILVHLGAPW